MNQFIENAHFSRSQSSLSNLSISFVSLSTKKAKVVGDGCLRYPRLALSAYRGARVFAALLQLALSSIHQV